MLQKIPYVGPIAGGIKPGMRLHVEGAVPPNAKQYAIIQFLKKVIENIHFIVIHKADVNKRSFHWCLGKKGSIRGNKKGSGYSTYMIKRSAALMKCSHVFFFSNALVWSFSHIQKMPFDLCGEILNQNGSDIYNIITPILGSSPNYF